MVRLMLVEDDRTMRETVAAYLTRAGHEVIAVGDGDDAVSRFAEAPVDLVLLDLMLPGMSGLDVTRRLRAMRRDLPLIMVTARTQEHERVQGLLAGADDYITKPYSLRELDLRIRSLLRRTTATAAEPSGVLVDGDLRVEVAAGRALRGGESLSLTSREFDLLVWFLQHPGVVHSREDLIREVWRWNVGDPSTVTVHVRRLREKIETDPSHPTRLATVFGKGYRWDATDTAVSP
ncbi:response regulator transcription factor [Microbacterium schleiferi]|uniref:Response regulator transcription factor n=1 Tax=Microbacterium schleiferi TaxID=69362 RepID=A0A7S8RIN8_9MICO|nr:response regulator transcription factor [Microbacterium schleiferi]